MNNSLIEKFGLHTKKTNLFWSVFFALFVLLSAFTAHTIYAVEKEVTPATDISVETNTDPEMEMKLPIADVDDEIVDEPAPAQFKTMTIQSASTESFGPNLIQNPSWETTSGGNPTGWFKGGYGTNNRLLSFPVTGYQSQKAGKVEISNYTSGDAKWYFTDVPVTPGKEYLFSDYYLASSESIVTIRYKKQDGTYMYPTLTILPPASTFTKASARFTVPQGVVSLTIFHLLKGKGSLTTDEYSLQEVIPAGGGGGIDSGLVINGDFEQTAGALPLGWYKGGWGTNDRTYTYPVAGVSGSKAAQVTITSRSSGDGKWYTDYIPVQQGTYKYTDAYASNVDTYLTVQYLHSNGSVSYADISLAPPTSGFWELTANIAIPLGVTHIRVFHLLNKVGTLTIDNASLVRLGSSDLGVFDTGAITLAFDDGWKSQYQNVVPKLDSSGLPATFYITTRQMYDYGFVGFMSQAQVKELYQKGYEIGAHTRTHAHLASLSESEQIYEIAGSRDDLHAMGIQPVTAFAYPFGEYNQSAIDVARNAGFTSARSTLNGSVTAASDHYQLARQSVEIDTTLAQVEAWVEDALAKKQWLILAFHQVTDDHNQRYNTKPAVFNDIIDYLVDNNVPVVTIEEGVASMAE